MSLGPAEILVILVIALVVFGPQRLPEVGRQVGAAMRELRRVQDTVRAEINGVLYSEPATPGAHEPPSLPAAPLHDGAEDGPTVPPEPGSFT